MNAAQLREEGSPQPPAVYDSDLILLAIARLQRVADKMQRLEYDAELEKHMDRAAEFFEWAAWNIANRNVREDEQEPSGLR